MFKVFDFLMVEQIFDGLANFPFTASEAKSDY